MSDQNNPAYERHTLRHAKGGDGVDVLGWGTYPQSSVLAGQPMKVWLDNFPTEEEARAAYPQAKEWSHPLLDPQVSLDHLPGPDDPVPGGMYPDDWTDDHPPSGSRRRP